MTIDGAEGTDFKIPRKLHADPPRIPTEAEDPLKRTVMQSESAYLDPYRNPKMLHSDASLERSIAFHHLATDARKFGGRLQELASGFAQVSLLGDDHGWTPFKSGLPKDLPVDMATRDLLLDIACMRVWFDKAAAGLPEVEAAIRTELHEVLEEFDLIAAAQDEDAEFDQPVVQKPAKSLQDIFAFLFSNNSIRLTPKEVSTSQ